MLAEGNPKGEGQFGLEWVFIVLSRGVSTSDLSMRMDGTADTLAGLTVAG